MSLDRARDGWCVLSYAKSGVVHYVKSFVGRDAILTMEFEYPLARAKRMGPVVTRVERSFRPAPKGVSPTGP